MVDDYNAGTEATDVEIQSWPDSSAMMAEIAERRAGPRPVPDHPQPRWPTSARRSSTRRCSSCSTSAGSTTATATTATPSRRSPPTTTCSACPTASRRWSSTTTPGSSTSTGCGRASCPAPEEQEEHDGWTFEQFRAAAEFASRPRRHTRGLYVAPSLAGLSPFIYAGGGEVYNDDNEPTSLAFSEDDTREALTESLELLRDPQVTLTDRQLAQRSRAGVVQARQARDAAGLPRAHPRAARGAEPRLRRDADGDARHRGHDRRLHRHVHLLGVVVRLPGRRLHGLRDRRGGAGSGGRAPATWRLPTSTSRRPMPSCSRTSCPPTRGCSTRASATWCCSR